MTRCLPVFAHPLEDSLNARFAATVEAKARAQGWQVTRRDLHAEGGDPSPPPDERAGFKATLAADIARLQRRL